VLATFILIIAAPVMALIALCVVLESPGPVFYRGVRAGWRGRQLAILKFRKMREGAFGRPLTLGDDERFTRIGGWLAWMKLDELPQLINVIRGEMSLVGPRPEDPVFIQLHPGAFEAILDVRPGITGLSQLAFRAEGRILDPNDPVVDYETRVLPQKIHLDSLYVARSNPLLDIRILCWTLAATLGVPVSVNRSTARMTVRLSRGGRRQTARASRDTPESETTATSEQWADRSTEAA
jgi:lipopolysaccharide/colanic/teichoic acid biosynthesis glycosyltransferase